MVVDNGLVSTLSIKCCHLFDEQMTALITRRRLGANFVVIRDTRGCRYNLCLKLAKGTGIVGAETEFGMSFGGPLTNIVWLSLEHG